jgi:hypothetical protein
VLVDDIRLEARDELWELSGRVTMDRLDTEGQRIWFRFPNEYSAGELDASPFLPGLLSTAMWWNEQLVIDGPVSAQLLASVDEASAIYGSLFPSLQAVVVAAPSHTLSPGEKRTACFFTRGVDSWYSVLTNIEKPHPGRPPLTHLVHVPSFDFMYSDENGRRSIAATRRATDDVGCELLLVNTNLRNFTERFQHFGITVGGVLSATGLAIGARFSHVLLAASAPLGVPSFSGCHVALDRLWSTERTAVVHDGATAGRLAKARLVAEQPRALERLKVCFVADTPTNCGRCEKCLITMIELHIARSLDECHAFERPLDPSAVSRMPDPGWQAFYFEEALDALGDDPRDVQLRVALEKVLLRRELASSSGRIRRLTGMLWAQARARRRTG